MPRPRGSPASSQPSPSPWAGWYPDPWMRAHLTWFLAGCVCLGGCCPFPWKRTTLIRPDGTVTVVDADTGEPLDGATVVLRRYRVGPPPRIETHRWESDTGPDGEASFEMELAKETVMPLMMHGVPQWGFEVCVRHEGHSALTTSWLVVDPQADRGRVGRIQEPLVVQLERGEAEACPWQELEKSP